MTRSQDRAPVTARDLEARAYATDWRRRCALLGPAGSPWAVPAVDVVIGALVLVVALVDSSLITRFGPHWAYVADVVLTVVIGLAQVLRRRAVRLSMAVTATALAAYGLLIAVSPVTLGLSPVSLVALLAVHAVIRWDGGPRWSLAALVLAVVGSLANPVVLHRFSPAFTARPGSEAIDGSGGVLITVVLADAVCLLAVALTALDASTRRRRLEDRYRELDAEREGAREAAAAEERLLLARELHDLLGHSLTAIKVQAATGLAVGGEANEARALGLIEATADSSLREVRELVRLLRGVGDVEPTASLTALRTAVDGARQAGLRLDAALPSGEELARADAEWTRTQRLAVLRAVQEGLTNALRHGDGAARLRVAIAAGRCVVEAVNALPADGPLPSPGSGTGLDGLRERMRLVGGSVEAGEREEPDVRVFALTATVPVSAAPTGPDAPAPEAPAPADPAPSIPAKDAR